jgi:hypothetical protein
MWGCRSCFEPRHSTGTSEEVSSFGSQPNGGRAFSRPPRLHPQRYEFTARVHPILYQGSLCAVGGDAWDESRSPADVVTWEALSLGMGV